MGCYRFRSAPKNKKPPPIVLKLLYIPIEINLPLTLVCFLIWYYVKLRKQRRS
jgi:hypothetical protein